MQPKRFNLQRASTLIDAGSLTLIPLTARGGRVRVSRYRIHSQQEQAEGSTDCLQVSRHVSLHLHASRSAAPIRSALSLRKRANLWSANVDASNTSAQGQFMKPPFSLKITHFRKMLSRVETFENSALSGFAKMAKKNYFSETVMSQHPPPQIPHPPPPWWCYVS